MKPTPDVLLDKAAEKISEGRDNAVVYLADQLRANRYDQATAEEVILAFVARLPNTDTQGRHDPYTEKTALYKLKRAYSQPAREPWATADDSPKRLSRRDRRERLSSMMGMGPTEPPAPPDPEKIEHLNRQLRTVKPLTNSPAEKYLFSRGIPAELAKRAKVKYSPSWGKIGETVIFPIIGEGGAVVAAVGRAVSGSGKQTFGPKSLGVFATPEALASDVLAVTEAPIDALSLSLCGMPSVALGGTSWPKWFGNQLAFKTIFIATDADSAGDSAADKLTAELMPFGAHCVRLRPLGAKDWNESLCTQGDEVIIDLVTLAYRHAYYRMAGAPDEAKSMLVELQQLAA